MQKTVVREKQTSLPLARLLKVFQIIAFLKAGRWNIRQLTERFDTSKSSLYRYLELIEEAGFCLEKDFHGRYFIVTTDDNPMQAQFTLEEMNLLRTLVQTDPAHPLNGAILKKLSLHSELDTMPRIFLKAHLGDLVEQLASAIRHKRQVVLKKYHSANSNGISNRTVEPIHFGDNYASIIALDLKDKECKDFKLDRIWGSEGNAQGIRSRESPQAKVIGHFRTGWRINSLDNAPAEPAVVLINA